MNLVKCISSKNDRNQIKQGYNSILAGKINQNQDTGSQFAAIFEQALAVEYSSEIQTKILRTINIAQLVIDTVPSFLRHNSIIAESYNS